MLPTVLNIILYYIISIPYVILFSDQSLYRRCPNLPGMETREKSDFLRATHARVELVHARGAQRYGRGGAT